jgi:hypothetical protein
MDFREVAWEAWTGLICFRIGTGDGFSEYGNELSVSIKSGIFFD